MSSNNIAMGEGKRWGGKSDGGLDGHLLLGSCWSRVGLGMSHFLIEIEDLLIDIWIVSMS